MGKKAFAVFVIALSIVARAELSVEERGGRLCVLRNGRVLVSEISVDRGGIGDGDIRCSSAVMQDGTRVWNRWSEVKDRRFRLEVAARSDGAVEITMMGQMGPDSKVRRRLLCLDIPAAALDGREYRCIKQSAGFKRYVEEGATFGEGLVPFFTRFLASDGVTYDFNPLGPGDYPGATIRTDGGNQLNRNGVIGMWMVERQESRYRLSSGDDVPTAWGGHTGGKIVLREGRFADYHRHHLIRSFRYYWPLDPARLLSFGAPSCGRAYQNGDVAYTAASGYGWVQDPSVTGRGARVGHLEGAYYSGVSGCGEDTYRLGGMPDGYYVLTVAFGNYAGIENRFSVAVGGETLFSDATIAKGTLRKISKTVRISGGAVDIDFSGTWLVSVIGLQPLLGKDEDFSVVRGLWVSDGFEPCTLYRNVDYSRPVKFAVSDETESLPVPGSECAATPRLPPMPVERPEPDDPRLGWLKTAKMQRLLDNTVSMSEFDEPGSLDRFIDGKYAGKDVKVVMLSGMHTRHTYIGHLERGIESIRRMCETLHRRGVKVIDHHDSTLLENICAGFRVMMERMDETLRSVETGLPSRQFCVSNPKYNETYYAYLRKLVEAGVDGFQIDELEFWYHGCICRHCRDAFRRDTGWEIPLNEMDARWRDSGSELRRRWHDWRRRAITNWFVELRRRVKDIRSDLVLSIYTTNDAFYSPFPKHGASSDIQDLGRVMNYFGAEMMTRSTMRNGRNLLPLAKMRTAVAPSGAAPVWVWYYNVDWANEYFAWGLSTLAGQTPLLSGVPAPANAARFEGFGLAAGAMDIDGAQTVAKVALLFPSFSRDWNVGSEYRPILFGTAQTLEAMHVPYDFISDDTLTSGRLDKYGFLFLGEAQCLSDAEVSAVNAFVARGGRVVMSPRAGTRDAFGMPRGGVAIARTGGVTVDDVARAAEFELDENWYTRKWTFDPDPKREAAFRREISGWIASSWDWHITASDKVFTSVWRERRGTYVVHLLNGTGVRMNPGDPVVDQAPNPAFPALDKDVLIEAPATVGDVAEAMSPDFAGRIVLSSSRVGDKVVFVLPRERLKVYTLVRIGTNLTIYGDRPHETLTNPWGQAPRNP